MAQTTFYEILELEPSATPEEIKAAYRQLSVKVHPDRGGSQALFRLVREAYETLSNSYRRGGVRPLPRQGDRRGATLGRRRRKRWPRK